MYDDLPPVSGESAELDSTTTWASTSKSTNTAPKQQQQQQQQQKAKGSLAFKPRQAVPRSTLIGVGSKALSVPAGTKDDDQKRRRALDALGLHQQQHAHTISESSTMIEILGPTSFEADDPYDPARPNDYLAWCEERLERRRLDKLEIENVKVMAERERERQELERNRAEAAQRGDVQALKASLGVAAGGIAVGRGRGISNLPAWMTQSNSHGSGTLSKSVDGAPVVRNDQAADEFEPPLEELQRSLHQRLSGAGGGGIGIGHVTSPTCVLILKNMVGPHEVDATLADETKEECLKYGPILSCVVHEVETGVNVMNVPVPDEEAVRLFVHFERQDSAIKAFRDMNGRFFGGRRISAGFYSEDRYLKCDLAPLSGEF